MKKRLSRRDFLRMGALATASAALAGCNTPTPQIIKETVEVEKVVEKTVEVEKIVEKTVEVEKTVLVEAPPSGPMQITWACWFQGKNSEPAYEDSYLERIVEDYFDVEITVWQFERSNWQQQIATRIAGGDMPDFMHYEANRTELIDQGVIIEVPFETIAEYAPNHFAATVDYNSLCWLGSYDRRSGKNFGVANMQPSQRHPFTDGWRMDALEAVGINEVPDTLEGYEEAYAKLQQNGYPYPTTARLGDWTAGAFNAIFGAHGTFAHHWIPREDGSGVDWGLTNDGARQTLALLQEWFAKGYISPEAPTTKWKDLVNAFCNGTVAYADCGTWYRLMPSGELYDCIDAAGGKVAHAWAPKGPDGKFGYPGWGFAVPPDVYFKPLEDQPEKLAKCLEILDVLNTDPEMGKLVRYGEEGKHHFVDEYGGLQLKPKDEIDYRDLGFAIFQPFVMAPALYYEFSRKDLDQLTEKARARNTEWLPDLGAFMDPDISKQASEVGPLMNAWEVDFITGQKSMDQWGEFLDARAAVGGDLLDEEANRAFKAMSDGIAFIEAEIAKVSK